MNSVDVIGHLIDMEHEAGGLLLDAQMEADRRIAAAKLEADACFKTEYNKFVKELEASYNEEILAMTRAHEQSMDEYVQSIKSAKQNKESFAAFLDSVLFL